MKRWQVILAVVCLVAGFAAGYQVRKTSEKELILRDTVVDTLRSELPIPSYEVMVEEVEVPFPIYSYSKGDTLRVHDTIYVPVPISRKVYETDDYRAVVSGFRPTLELLDIYRKKEIVYRKESRFGLGVIAGYGVGCNGLSPYVGLGGFYRIF